MVLTWENSKKGIWVNIKSGTLTYGGVKPSCKRGLWKLQQQLHCGDPIIGLSYKQLLPMFETDPETEAIVMIGEIVET